MKSSSELTDYDAKYPKTAQTLRTEADEPTTHFGLAAEHGKHSSNRRLVGSLGTELIWNRAS